MSNDSTNLITPSMREGELRILDTDLAVRLGFATPRMIRKLIKRYLPELDKLGPRSTVERVVNGGNATEYYLNRKQAIFITAKSETAEATDITIEIIERFDAYERGEAKPAIAPETPEMLAFRAITALQGKLEVMEEQAKLQAAMLEVAQPKAEALDRISIASGEYGLTETAKIIQIKPGKFFDWLDANRCRYTKGKVKLAYQDKIDAGYFRNRATFYTDTNGEQQAGNTIRVTPKGLAWLARVVPGAKLDPAFEGAASVPFTQAPA